MLILFLGSAHRTDGFQQQKEELIQSSAKSLNCTTVFWGFHTPGQNQQLHCHEKDWDQGPEAEGVVSTQQVWEAGKKTVMTIMTDCLCLIGNRAVRFEVCGK